MCLRMALAYPKMQITSINIIKLYLTNLNEIFKTLKIRNINALKGDSAIIINTFKQTFDIIYHRPSLGWSRL